MQISEYLNIHKLSSHCREGYVHAGAHKTLPLVIYTYTRKTVYDDFWDDVTTKCRGLIVNTETQEIVARPFKKFFNLNTESHPETCQGNLPEEWPIVTEKLDGNLAIYYRLGDYEGIASKGSFHSEHAEYATAWYRRNCGGTSWPEGYTPVFEQIAEDVQHHVVHYGEGKQGLYLLALINNLTGEEYDSYGMHVMAAEKGLGFSTHYWEKSVQDVVQENRPNAEGYVLTWPRPGQPPLKVKVKHEDFLRLQKLRKGITSKVIFQALRDENEDALAQMVTTEDTHLNKRAYGIIKEFQDEYKQVFAAASELVKYALTVCTSRREFAALFLSPAYKEISGPAFNMIDQANHQPAIWKIVGDRLKKKLDAEEQETAEGVANGTH